MFGCISPTESHATVAHRKDTAFNSPLPCAVAHLNSIISVTSIMCGEMGREHTFLYRTDVERRSTKHRGGFCSHNNHRLVRWHGHQRIRAWTAADSDLGLVCMIFCICNRIAVIQYLNPFLLVILGHTMRTCVGDCLFASNSPVYGHNIPRFGSKFAGLEQHISSYPCHSSLGLRRTWNSRRTW